MELIVRELSNQLHEEEEVVQQGRAPLSISFDLDGYVRRAQDVQDWRSIHQVVAVLDSV